MRSIRVLRPKDYVAGTASGAVVVDSPEAIRGASIGWRDQAWLPDEARLKYHVTITFTEEASTSLAIATADAGLDHRAGLLLFVRDAEVLYEVSIPEPIAGTDARIGHYPEQSFDEFFEAELGRLCPETAA